MKFYERGENAKPAIFPPPGSCSHRKANFVEEVKKCVQQTNK